MKLFTVSANPYAQDTWFLYIDTIEFRCTAAKEILTLDGYLPSHTWSVTSLGPVPKPVEDWSLAFDEPFDESGRLASESLPYRVLSDPGRRMIQIVFGEPSGWPEFVVSPHQDFLVGADPDRGMSLSSVWLLNVVGPLEISGEM